MFAFVVRRLLYAIPIVLATTLLLFLIFNIVPGDPVYQVAGKHLTPEIYESIKHELGLDKPLWEQYLVLLKQLATFDFGRSYATKQLISEMMFEGMGVSFSLLFPPFIISVVTSVLFGILLAYYRGTKFDRFVVAGSVAMQAISVIVYIIVGQYVFAYLLGWFPISGYDPSWTGRWQYLMLPAIIDIVLTLAPEIRFYRTVFLDEIGQDYVRTARSKGLPDKTVMTRHVLKNAMIPIITNVVLSLPLLILGAVLIESYFSIPGLGELIVRAISNSDRPVLIAVTIVGTLVYVFFNILSDVLYAVADPRVQLK